MLPPPQRKHTNSEMHEFQQRPHFATSNAPVTKTPKHVAAHLFENLQTPMQKSCQRGHEEVVEPLLTVNRYREDYAPRPAPYTQGCAMNHKLIPKAQHRKQHMVSTWDSA